MSDTLDIEYFEYCRNNQQFRLVYHFEILASYFLRKFIDWKQFVECFIILLHELKKI